MSQNSINIKEIWYKQETVAPDINEILKKASQFRRAELSKILLANVIGIFTSALILFIWTQYKWKLGSTTVGISITIIAIAMHLFAYNRMLPLFKEKRWGENTAAHLDNLIRISQRQRFINTRLLNVYFLLFGAGLALYLLESALKMNFAGALLTYLITFSWIVVNWFYLKPILVKKQEKRLNNLIMGFESLREQLKKESSTKPNCL